MDRTLLKQVFKKWNMDKDTEWDSQVSKEICRLFSGWIIQKTRGSPTS